MFSDTIADLEEHKLSKSSQTEEPKQLEDEVTEEDKEDKYEEEESPPSKFAGVFSDTESEEEEEEDGDEWVTFPLSFCLSPTSCPSSSLKLDVWWKELVIFITEENFA